MQSLFCPNNADNWENMVCACRNVNHSLLSVAPCLNQLCLGAQGQLWNSVVLVCCCVFCLERRAVIKFTSCWVRCCQAHTYSTLVSHLSAPYPLRSFLSFFSPVGWEAGRMKAERLSIKAKLCRNDSFSWFWLLICKFVIKGALEGFSRVPIKSGGLHKRQIMVKMKQQRLRYPEFFSSVEVAKKNLDPTFP